jgi:hypothetical protein
MTGCAADAGFCLTTVRVFRDSSGSSAGLSHRPARTVLNQSEIIEELPDFDKEDILAALRYKPNARPSSYYSGDNKSQKHPQEEIGLKPGFILRYPHTPD